MICNDCGHVFDIKDAVIGNKNSSFCIGNKRCPRCGGVFRSLELPEELDKYLYVDRDTRFYSYSDKKN